MFSNLSMTLIFLASVAVLAPVKAAPLLMTRQNATSPAGNSPATATGFVQQNGLDAQQLNARFSTINSTDACTGNEMACVQGGFAQCVGGKWQVQQCAAGLSCYALPLVNNAGTSLACDTDADALARFTAAGVSGGINGTDTSAAPAGTDSAADDSDGDIDDEDLPFCDEDDAFSDAPSSTATVAAQTASVASPTAAPSQAAVATTSAAGGGVAQNNYRRQASTIVTLPPITSAVTALSVGLPATGTNNPIVTPTVAIGTNGIVTVTVVSTVTVSATNCASTVPSIPIATPVPITDISAIPSSVPVLTNTTTISAPPPSAPIATFTTGSVASSPLPIITLSNQPAPSGLSFTLGTIYQTPAAAAATASN